jgi:hypothetical protein
MIARSAWFGNSVSNRRHDPPETLRATDSDHRAELARAIG